MLQSDRNSSKFCAPRNYNEIARSSLLNSRASGREFAIAIPKYRENANRILIASATAVFAYGATYRYASAPDVVAPISKISDPVKSPSGRSTASRPREAEEYLCKLAVRLAGRTVSTRFAATFYATLAKNGGYSRVEI